MQNIVFRHSTKARYLRITIKSSGECVVTIPKRVPRVLVARFLKEKQAWIREKQDYMKKRAWEGEKLTSRPFSEAKLDALHFTTQRVEAMNILYGFSYKGIAVKNQKTRWGSCSKHGNLNFNYRILFLPPHLADYLIVHELCHLKEFNHSQKFWNLVAQTFPNYRELRRELRRYALFASC